MIVTVNLLRPNITITANNQPVSINASAEIARVNLNVSKSPLLEVPLSLEQRLAKLESTGYVVCVNNEHTQEEPFLINADVEFVLPIKEDSFFGENLSGLIDSETHKILVTNLNDSFVARVEFKLKTVLNSRKGSFNFDIGAAERFNHVRVQGAEDAANVERVSFLIPFYQLDTFQQNGALLKGVLDGDGEIYDVRVLFIKIRHGQNL